MAIRARTLEEGDAEAYKDLRLEGLERSPIAFANSYEQIQQRPVDIIRQELRDNIVIGVFHEGENLVGIGGIRREEPAKMDHKGIVYGNYVREGMRRKGVGKLIMLELEKRARAVAPTMELPAFEELQLRVVQGNDAALKLYESLGYTKFGYSDRAVRYKGEYVGEHYLHKYLNQG